LRWRKVSTQVAQGNFYVPMATTEGAQVARYNRGTRLLTSLATQRACVEMLGSHGRGHTDKFAEICAGVVLAGETSLSAAVIHGDWVASHDQFGRNRK